MYEDTNSLAIDICEITIVLILTGSDTLLCHDIYQNINKTGENQIIFNRENETVCSSSKTWHWFNATAQVPLRQVRYLSSVST